MRSSWGRALGPTEPALESLDRRRTYLTDIFWQAPQRSICPFFERVASTSRSHLASMLPSLSSLRRRMVFHVVPLLLLTWIMRGEFRTR
jgi:hypothetical protein